MSTILILNRNSKKEYLIELYFSSIRETTKMNCCIPCLEEDLNFRHEDFQSSALTN